MKTSSLLALGLVIGFAGQALGDLKIRDIKARHGRHGPERESLNVAPGDEVIFCFTVTGVDSDADGKVDCELAQKITDADGKVLLDVKTPVKDILAFAGDQMPSFGVFNFGLKTPPGIYNTRIAVTDKLRGETVAFERAITVMKPEFAVIRPRFSYDAEGKTNGSLTNTLGTRLFYRMIAVGFDRSQKKVDLIMTMQLYDEKNKALIPKPLEVKIVSEDEDAVAKAETVTFTGFFSCNRPGTFTARSLTITDRVTMKTVKFTAPLKVVD